MLLQTEKIMENRILLTNRIDTENAAQVEKDLLDKAASIKEDRVELDASDLEYVSSAGLRALLNLINMSGKSVAIINVSPSVYEIFEMTGFTELMEVHKSLREISIEGLPLIGEGATSKVYRLEKDIIVKVFNKTVVPDMIKKEMEHSKYAFLSGVPTAITYDIVKVGDCYGSVFELLDAKDFLDVIRNDKEHMDDYIRRFALSVRKMNSIEVDTGRFLPIKQQSIALFSQLGSICTEDEIKHLQALYSLIPDRNTFVHGDCHPGNMMMKDGEFVLIDMTTCGSGHPVFDLLSMCVVYYMKPLFNIDDHSPLCRGFSKEEMMRIWNIYIRTYLDSDDDEYIESVTRQIMALASARTLLATIFIPGLLTPEYVNAVKGIALSYMQNSPDRVAF